MSQIKQWAVSATTGTTVARQKLDGSSKGGDGHSQHLYVGVADGYTYTSYLIPTLDWTGVGKIIRATLVLFTDDFLGLMQQPSSSDSPHIQVRQLTSAFLAGNNPEGDFDSSDDTHPTWTSAGGTSSAMTQTEDDPTRIDITAIVNAWAPKTVRQSSDAAGGGQKCYGIGLFRQSSDAKYAWSGWSSHATDPAVRPFIELVYEYGLTAPNVPTNLSPSGAVASIGSFQGDFSDPKTSDELRVSEVQVYTAAATNTGQTVTGAAYIYDIPLYEGDTAITNQRFDHIPVDLHLKRNTTYKWRARVRDQEGQWSLWTDLTSFSVTNTDPVNPVLSPVDGSSYTSLDGVQFAGLYDDPDDDPLLAYQVQMSAYPEGDSHWDEADSILWNTGKRYVSTLGQSSWQTPYGGAAVDSGTYYWRARHWDSQQGVSDWVYASIILTSDFIVEADASTNAIQMRPRVPWRIVIKDMLQADGVTPTVGRGPGRTVAVLEDANNVGASLMYNSPGEAHWTLVGTHPQISVIEPKQTHYAIEFRQGDGWREVFAGLVDDFDANDSDVIFYGIDYLGLLARCVDEHYDPTNPDLPAEKGGSKYVSAGKNTISYIITDQLKRARETANSLVGFISTGTIDAMTETVTVYSTYAPALDFIVGLIDSHRAGSGKRTRLYVRKADAGGYEFVVKDDPGATRDNLRMRYGELVQGYRVVPFGTGWSSRIAGVGRDKDGVRVRYKTLAAPGIDESVWGRWVQPQFFDGVADANDFERKVRQAAIASSKLGRQIGLGLRSGVLQPRDGYDLCDYFPVDIEHQAVSTSAFGSGYWQAVGITWTALQRGDLNTILTLLPKEDTHAPSSDLLTLQPISRQAEWQIGWQDPNPLGTPTSTYWLDQSTGKVYKRQSGDTINDSITGTA